MVSLPNIGSSVSRPCSICYYVRLVPACERIMSPSCPGYTLKVPRVYSKAAAVQEGIQGLCLEQNLRGSQAPGFSSSDLSNLAA